MEASYMVVYSGNPKRVMDNSLSENCTWLKKDYTVCFGAIWCLYLQHLEE